MKTNNFLKNVSIFLHNLKHASNLPVFKPHFYPAGVKSRTCEQIFYKTSGLFAAALILLQDDIYFQTRKNIASVLSFHDYFNRFSIAFCTFLNGNCSSSSSIHSVISSLHKLPMLPSCVWFTVFSGLKEAFSISAPICL